MAKWGKTSLQAILESAAMAEPLSRIRRMDLLINVTQYQRTLWLKLFDAPNLQRILADKPDLIQQPITEDEKLFVNLIILHLTTVLTAVRQGLVAKPAGQDDELKVFLRLPIPRLVWQQTRSFHDSAITCHLDALLAE